MNIRLAVQTLSKSVGTAIIFCKNNNIAGFEDSDATVKFLFMLNKIFDIFNTRNLLSCGFKKPLQSCNEDIIFSSLEEAKDYISNLSCPVTGKKITSTCRKTGFVGFLVAIKSLRILYEDNNNL